MMGRKRETPEAGAGQETAGSAVPPALTETADTLRAAATEAAKPEGEEGAPRRRRRRRQAADPDAPPAIEWPVQTLTEMHAAVWTEIAVRLRATYRLTPQGAEEMARFMSIMLSQYVTPYLAEHAALAGYLLCQVTALSMCIATRQPAPAKPAATETPA